MGNARKYIVNIENKKSRYDYFVEEKLECGIVLRGNEIKSIRSGQVSIKDAWVSIENGELIAKKIIVKPWETSNSFDTDENRDKKLLAHKKEIQRLSMKIKTAGYTLIVCRIYINNSNKCKVELGLAKGKHNYDKRNSEKINQINKDICRAIKNNR